MKYLKQLTATSVLFSLLAGVLTLGVSAPTHVKAADQPFSVEVASNGIWGSLPDYIDTGDTLKVEVRSQELPGLESANHVHIRVFMVNDAGPITLYDDGTNGDVTQHDNVYTNVFEISKAGPNFSPDITIEVLTSANAEPLTFVYPLELNPAVCSEVDESNDARAYRLAVRASKQAEKTWLAAVDVLTDAQATFDSAQTTYDAAFTAYQAAKVAYKANPTQANKAAALAASSTANAAKVALNSANDALNQATAAEKVADMQLQKKLNRAGEESVGLSDAELESITLEELERAATGSCLTAI